MYRRKSSLNNPKRLAKISYMNESGTSVCAFIFLYIILELI